MAKIRNDPRKYSSRAVRAPSAKVNDAASGKQQLKIRARQFSEASIDARFYVTFDPPPRPQG